MASNVNSSLDNSLVNKELQQTLDELKDIEAELLDQKNELLSILSKTPVKTVPPDVKPEDIQLEQLRFVKAILNEKEDYDDRIRPIKYPADVFASLDADLLQEIADIQEVLGQTKTKFMDLKSNINSLINEKNNLQKIKEMCSDAVESVDAETTDDDIVKIKRAFKTVKNDLATVVDIIYPDVNFHALLKNLINAYFKEGDEKYIDVEEVALDCVQSLVEADLAMYHRNDRTKIRLVDIL